MTEVEQAEAVWMLEVAERRFLRAHGWTKEGDCWRPPADQGFKYKSGYTHGHAVNAQKQRTYDRRSDLGLRQRS